MLPIFALEEKRGAPEVALGASSVGGAASGGGSVFPDKDVVLTVEEFISCTAVGGSFTDGDTTVTLTQSNAHKFVGHEGVFFRPSAKGELVRTRTCRCTSFYAYSLGTALRGTSAPLKAVIVLLNPARDAAFWETTVEEQKTIRVVQGWVVGAGLDVEAVAVFNPCPLIDGEARGRMPPERALAMSAARLVTRRESHEPWPQVSLMQRMLSASIPILFCGVAAKEYMTAVCDSEDSRSIVACMQHPSAALRRGTKQLQAKQAEAISNLRKIVAASGGYPNAAVWRRY
jgi:hypothetical protein